MKNQLFHPFDGLTLDDFDTSDPGPAEAHQQVSRYIENLKDNVTRVRGLLLIGPAGTGKTFLASMVMKAAMEESYRIECIELSAFVGLYLEMFNLNNWIRTGQAYGEDVEAASRLWEQIKGIRGRPLLFLDDIGREHESGSGWSNESVFDLVRWRYARKLPTIMTSNLPLRNMEDRYTEGFVSFLYECSEIILVDGEDYRCKRAN